MKCNVTDLMHYWQENNAFRSKEWYEKVISSCFKQAFINRLEGIISEEYLNTYVKTPQSIQKERQSIYAHAMTIFTNVKNSTAIENYLQIVKLGMEIEQLEDELNKLSFWQFRRSCALREQLDKLNIVSFEDVMLILQHHYTTIFRYQRDDFYNLCIKLADKWLENE